MELCGVYIYSLPGIDGLFESSGEGIVVEIKYFFLIFSLECMLAFFCLFFCPRFFLLG